MSWSSTADRILKRTQRAFSRGAVTYTPPEGAAVELRHFVFRAATEKIDTEVGIEVRVPEPHGVVRLADLPNGRAESGATIETGPGYHPSYPDGARFVVHSIDEDGEGGATLGLQLAPEEDE